MTDLNRIIHAWLHPEVCWHEYNPDRRAWLKRRTFFGLTTFVDNPDANLCIKCGKDAGIPLQVNNEPLVSTSINVPDYENDLNAVREAELKAIEVFGLFQYGEALKSAIGRWEFVEFGYCLHAHFATADAKTRSQAIRRLIEKTNA